MEMSVDEAEKLLEMSVDEAEKLLERHLRTYHSLTLEDVEITDTKGYWKIKKLCDETCHHPIHTCLGCEGRSHHTISYALHGRNEKGQFESPYEVWNILHDNQIEVK